MKKILSFAFLIFWGVSTVFAQDISDNIERVLGSVVTVAVEKTLPAGKVLMGFRGGISEEAYAKSLELTNAVSSGSGFTIDRNGKKYIVTNAHVVESASDESGSIFVYTFNRKKYEVRVLGGDSFYDIAVLEFVQSPGNNVNALTFANQLPRIASKVYAVGNPLGEYPYTVTDGIVSAVNRMRDGTTGKYGFIQSTATVIWGNSGGPLVNEQGTVVGINSQIAFAPTPDGGVFQMQQINFALESPLASKLVDDIIAKGKPVRSYIGIELSMAYRMQKTQEGWAITGSVSDLPIITGAFKGTDALAKLSDYGGWFLKSVNGVEINNLEEALGEFEKVKPNSQVKIRITNETSSTKDIVIQTVELKPSHLEQLATEILKKIPNVEVDGNSPQLRIYSTERQKGFNSRNVGYYLAGGGNADADDLWRITTLSDLGALLRIYGLRGGVEYYLVNDSNVNGDVQVYKQFFGDRDDLFQTMLWY